MKWLIRPARYKDESPTGYLYRVAEANGYFTLKGWRRENTYHPIFNPIERADRANYEALGRKIFGDRFTLVAYQRICPLCMQDNPYIRISWDHALLTSCLVHQVRLVCYCPQCKAIFRRQPGCVEKCICGLYFSEMTPRKALPSETECLLAEKLGLSDIPYISSLAELLSELSSMELINLIVLLGTFSLSGVQSKPRKVALKQGSEKALNIVLKADEILSEWPITFHAVLSMKYEGFLENNTLEHVFGHFYRTIYREFRGHHFSFLREELEHWIQKHWKGYLTQRHTRLDSKTRATNNVLPITLVSKETGVSAERLEQLVKSRRLRGSTRTLPSGRKTTMIELNQEQQIYDQSNNLTLQVVSNGLGVSKSKLRILLKDGFIYGSRPKKGSKWAIPNSEMRRFQAWLATIRQSDGSEDERFCTMNHVVRFLLSESDNFSLFFESILRGGIDCCRDHVSRKLSVSDILVDKESLRQWQRRTGIGVSVQELARRLKVKQEVAYHLVREKFIRTWSQGRLGAFTSETDISNFNDIHIWARDIAQLVNSSPRKVIATLRDANVEPVAGPDIDGCRQFLFLRKSVSESGVFSRASEGAKSSNSVYRIENTLGFMNYEIIQ